MLRSTASPSFLRSSLSSPTPSAHRRAGDAGPTYAATAHFAALDSIQSENRTEQLGATGADEAGNADHLTAMQ